MRYFEKEQAQLECDLLNRKGGTQYTPVAIQVVPHREFAKREMWQPHPNRILTDAYVRRTCYHHKDEDGRRECYHA